MARFDVYRSRKGDQLLIDCQADRLSHMKTRFVVPLLPAETIPDRVGALHPEFAIGDRRVVLATHLASAILASDLGAIEATLRDEDHRIVRALDVLIGTA